MTNGNAHRDGFRRLNGWSEILPEDRGFSDWKLPLQVPDATQSSPGILAFEGMVLLPNLVANAFELYSLAALNGGPRRKLSLPCHGDMSRASTPVQYGIHLYVLSPGLLEKVSLLDGTRAPVVIAGTDPRHFIPAPNSTPLVVEHQDDTYMVFALQNHLLIFQPATGEGGLVALNLTADDHPRSPVAYGAYVTVSSRLGKIVSVNLDTGGIRNNATGLGTLSAPVVMYGAKHPVFFECLSADGARHLVCYDPFTDQGESVTIKQGSAPDPAQYETALSDPPLCCTNRIFLTDRQGKLWIQYKLGHVQYRTLEASMVGAFIPSRSLYVDNKLYSASQRGLLTWDLESQTHRTEPLVHKNEPLSPIAAPICYGDKLLILCRGAVFCKTILRR